MNEMTFCAEETFGKYQSSKYDYAAYLLRPKFQ